MSKIKGGVDGRMKLADFSVWLAEYNSNDRSTDEHIEIPGQYTGVSEPVPSTHVTITNFDQLLLVLNSIRKPKKLTIHGSNEKSYDFLVKGGEDLRLDQRIEQLFSVMNEIFTNDKQCL